MEMADYNIRSYLIRSRMPQSGVIAAPFLVLRKDDDMLGICVYNVLASAYKFTVEWMDGTDEYVDKRRVVQVVLLTPMGSVYTFFDLAKQYGHCNGKWSGDDHRLLIEMVRQRLPELHRMLDLPDVDAGEVKHLSNFL